MSKTMNSNEKFDKRAAALRANLTRRKAAQRAMQDTDDQKKVEKPSNKGQEE